MRLVREAMAFFRSRGRTLGTLAALSVVAAQIESVALVTVAMTVGAVARGDTEVSLHLGPVSAHLSTAAATLMVLILFVVTASITAIFVLIQSSVAASVERHYRDRIVASFAAADWTTQSRQRTGRLNGQLKLTVAAPQAFSSLTIWIRSAATVVVFLVAALVVSPVTTLVTAALGAAFSVMVLPLRRRLRRIVAVGTGGELEFAQEFAEGAEMAQDLRVFSGWPRLIDRLSVISSRLETLRRSIHIIGSSLPLSYQYGGPIVILGVVAVLSTVSGTVEIAPLAAVALLLLRCAQYGQSVQGAQQILAESVTILDALERELAAFQVNRAGDEGVHLDPVTRLSLHDLSYTYPGSTKPALEQVNLELAARTVVGVVGPSGGGKSTLAQILLRLREPTQGQLIVNGLAADEYSEQSWYARVSHVPQQPRLLHATVAENIAFLDESIARADIDAAGKKVGLDEFVRQLPNGYDTPIGPAMHNLSGGQAQRIGIARALVRNPDVLILDEPTSALDSSSEMLIQRALEQLKRDSDVLLVIIAHRLSTLSVCDELVVLDGGRIKVHGTLTEALEASTYFREALEASTLKV